MFGHAANLYHDYMIITFGEQIDFDIAVIFFLPKFMLLFLGYSMTGEYNSQVYLYNVTSNMWVTSFIPPPPDATPNIQTSPIEKSSIIFWTAMSLVVVILIWVFVAIFIIRKRKIQRERQTILEISGNNY